MENIFTKNNSPYVTLEEAAKIAGVELGQIETMLSESSQFTVNT